MLQLRIDSEILAAAAAMWLRLSGRNEMPDNSQTKTRVEKNNENASQNQYFQIGPLNRRRQQREAIGRIIVLPQ